MRAIHLIRVGVPLALAAAGAYVVWGTDVEGVGEALIAAAVCVVVANLLFRYSFTDVKDREREERAREYFDEHGHWPDERSR